MKILAVPKSMPCYYFNIIYMGHTIYFYILRQLSNFLLIFFPTLQIATRWAPVLYRAAIAGTTMASCMRRACIICPDRIRVASASATVACPRHAKWCSARRSASANPFRPWAVATIAVRSSAWMISLAMAALILAFDWWPVASLPRSHYPCSSFWWIVSGSVRCGPGRIVKMLRISAASLAALGKRY